jgi:hypothetical protein
MPDPSGPWLRVYSGTGVHIFLMQQLQVFDECFQEYDAWCQTRPEGSLGTVSSITGPQINSFSGAMQDINQQPTGYPGVPLILRSYDVGTESITEPELISGPVPVQGSLNLPFLVSPLIVCQHAFEKCD